MRHGRARSEPEDQDLGEPGAEIADPLLKVVGPGPDTEPAPEKLLKGRDRYEDEANTGAPAAGRSSIQEVRRKGPVGFLQMLGPGLITGASDDDPSGIGTYSQVGSQFGYGLLWTAVFTFPFMAGVQELCARIALQTGVRLGTSLKRKFPRWIVGLCIAALFVANTINVGADLGAIAASVNLIFPAIPAAPIVLPIAAGILVLTIFGSYHSKKLPRCVHTNLFERFKARRTVARRSGRSTGSSSST